MKCSDGKVQGTEICDDGGLGGCKSDCSGPNPGFSCSAGSFSSASICSSVCGDGILSTNEKCDDHSKGGCLSDCTGVSANYECD